MTKQHTQRVAFIGLGVMGFPMAGHLAGASHNVCVYNRSPDKTKRWLERFVGRAAASPALAAVGADFVFLCVGDDDSVREVLTGADGALAAMTRGSVLIDHTTASAGLAREMSTLAAAGGVAFVDAPVSGGEAGAVNGALTVMAGGDEAAYARAAEVFACYASNARLIGPTGSGQLAKMVNQICIAGLVQGLAEGLRFMEACGLDGDKVMAAIGKGAAQSWQMENRYATMLKREFEFGFAVDWMRKDLGMALEEARRHGVHLPVTALVDACYAKLQERGGGRFDTSSLIALLDDTADP